MGYNPYRDKGMGMQRVTAVLLLTLTCGALAGCGGGGQDLPVAKGQLFPLNGGMWSPTKDDLKIPRNLRT